MDPATAFFVRQQLARFAADCRTAQQRVERATTLREVKQWSDVHPHSVVASIAHTVPEVRQLEFAKESRAGHLVDLQLKDLWVFAHARDTGSFRRRLDELREREWVYLRGEHPRLLNRIDRELASLERELNAAGDRPRPSGG